MKKQLTSLMVLAAALLALTLAFVSCGGNKTEELAQHLRVASIDIFPRNMTLLAGDTGNFIWNIEPDTAANKTVKWESSNSSIARVSNGVVTGVADGTTTIKASSEQDPSKSMTCQVLIVSQASGFVPVTGVTLNRQTLSMGIGDVETLTATVQPSNATDNTVSWFSDNVTVARVSNTGVVTAVGDGTATISVIANYGGIKATCPVTVTSNAVSVTGVSLNKSATTLRVGDTETLIANVQPANATDKAVSWFSNNITVARVSSTGVVTAMGVGTATITVITNYGGRTATCVVTVTPNTGVVPVTGVSLNKSSTSVTVSGTETLTTTVQPANATNKAVTWSSSNTGIATVSASGLVTGVAVGTATITVTTADGGRTAMCVVTVNTAVVPVTGVTLNKTSTTITAGGTETLTATVQPSNATNKNVTWSSNNTGVATINNGLVTAQSQGTATITVTTQDGGRTASCVVTVQAAHVGPDVYVAGDFGLWKNGVLQPGYDGIGGSSIFVSGNDVYLTGGPNATLWKNGVPQFLSSSNSRATSVFVSGNDVYVAGFEENYNSITNTYTYTATLWKNGVPQRLSDGSFDALAGSVFVSGNDVYVAGEERNGEGMMVATLWKNGVPQRLSSSNSGATSVFVSGNDVYVAGVEENYNSITNTYTYTATLWKNGVPQRLGDGSNNTHVKSIFVSGNDVYVAGYEYEYGTDHITNSSARLWKNGVPQRLSLSDGSNQSSAERYVSTILRHSC